MSSPRKDLSDFKDQVNSHSGIAEDKQDVEQGQNEVTTHVGSFGPNFLTTKPTIGQIQ